MEYSVKQITPFRLLSIYAYDAIKKGHNMDALVEFDVTEIRKRLRFQRKKGRNISFFGFLISAIGSSVKKPGAVKLEIEIREYLSLIICINHDLVDGALAARFVTRLKQRIEGNYYN